MHQTWHYHPDPEASSSKDLMTADKDKNEKSTTIDENEDVSVVIQSGQESFTNNNNTTKKHNRLEAY